MPTYTEYQGVRRLQTFLEHQADQGVFSYEWSLRERNAEGFDYFDGKYGPDTDAAFQAYLGVTRQNVTGALTLMLSEGAINTNDIAQIGQAMAEYTAKTYGAAPPPLPPATTGEELAIPGIPQTGTAWSTTTWLLIGAGIAVVSYVGYKWYQKKHGKLARSHGEFGELAELDGDCGCGM